MCSPLKSNNETCQLKIINNCMANTLIKFVTTIIAYLLESNPILKSLHNNQSLSVFVRQCVSRDVEDLSKLSINFKFGVCLRLKPYLWIACCSMWLSNSRFVASVSIARLIFVVDLRLIFVVDFIGPFLVNKGLLAYY